jgi:hypothetical protein
MATGEAVAGYCLGYLKSGVGWRPTWQILLYSCNLFIEFLAGGPVGF